MGTHFITISPSMRNNILALRITLANNQKLIKNLSITVRSKMMIENPVAATYTFYRLLEKFFEIIVNLPLTDFTGKCSNIEGLLSRIQEKNCGAYGPIKAYYGIIEEQSGGTLHFHGILFGGWNIKKFQQECHNP